MAAPGRAMRAPRLTPGEVYRRHVQRKKVIALIAGLLLLPVSILMIVAYDRGPLGRSVSDALGFSIGAGREPQPTPTVAALAQAPSPTLAACLDTVFNGLVFDAETQALLGGVAVDASFGASVVTSPDGEYNILVCYDPAVHDGFTLSFEKDGYESASLEVVTTGYPGISSQVADVGLYALQTATPVPTLFEPPRQTPLPTLFQPPRQTPLPTATATLFEPPRQTPLPTSAASDSRPTPAPTQPADRPAPTAVPTVAPPNTLPNTGIAAAAFPGQTVGFVLLAVSLMLIAAGVWPHDDSLR